MATAPVSPLIRGGLPSQETQNLQGVRANRILETMRQSGANARAGIAASTARAGQASAERIAGANLAAQSQMQDAEHAAQLRAKDVDRKAMEAMAEMMHKQALDRDTITHNRKVALAGEDRAAMERWQKEDHTFQKALARTQLTMSAAQMKMLYGLLGQQFGQATADEKRLQSTDHMAESFEAKTNQSASLRNSIQQQLQGFEILNEKGSLPAVPLTANEMLTRVFEESNVGIPALQGGLPSPANIGLMSKGLGVTDLFRPENQEDLARLAATWDYGQWTAVVDGLELMSESLDAASRKATDVKAKAFIQSQQLDVRRMQVQLDGLYGSDRPLQKPGSLGKTLGQQFNRYQMIRKGLGPEAAAKIAKDQYPDDPNGRSALFEELMHNATTNAMGEPYTPEEIAMSEEMMAGWAPLIRSREGEGMASPIVPGLNNRPLTEAQAGQQSILDRMGGPGLRRLNQ